MGFEAVGAALLDAGAEEVATEVIGDAVVGGAVDAATDIATSVVMDSAAEGAFAEGVAGAAAEGAAAIGEGAASAIAESGLTAAQVSAAQSAGWSLGDIAKAVQTGGSVLNTLKGIVGPIANVAGTRYAANAATTAAAQQAQASRDAANVLAPAATQSANILSTGAKNVAGVLAPAAKDAAAMVASGADVASTVMSDAYKNAYNGEASTVLDSGQKLSAADIAAGKTMSEGYNTATGQQVESLNSAKNTAGNVLSSTASAQQPFISAGTDALKTLTAGLQPGGQFNKGFTMADAQNMPAYQFALEQGKAAIDASAARGGTQLSSNNIQSLTKFAEGTAAQYEQQAFDQWMSQNNLSLGALQNMVKTGQISTDQLQAALNQYGISAETIDQNIGAAKAAGTLGAAKSTATGQLTSAQDLAAAANKAAELKARGTLGAGQAVSTGVVDSTRAMAGGITGYADAVARGVAGSANADAGGVTGAANATAAGIMGAGGATAAGTAAKGNIVGSGASDLFNNVFTMASAPGSVTPPANSTQPVPLANINATQDPLLNPATSYQTPTTMNKALDSSFPVPSGIPIQPVADPFSQSLINT